MRNCVSGENVPISGENVPILGENVPISRGVGRSYSTSKLVNLVGV